MEQWQTLLDVLILLAAALALGALCERLRQSAILGYLLAGTLLGPNALQIVGTSENVETLAELGVALLLFTIGLEFSWQRLRRMGASALGGGVAQVLVTMALAGGAAMLCGIAPRPAIALGWHDRAQFDRVRAAHSHLAGGDRLTARPRLAGDSAAAGTSPSCRWC